jgi:hypothetical protein
MFMDREHGMTPGDVPGHHRWGPGSGRASLPITTGPVTGSVVPLFRKPEVIIPQKRGIIHPKMPVFTPERMRSYLAMFKGAIVPLDRLQVVGNGSDAAIARTSHVPTVGHRRDNRVC